MDALIFNSLRRVQSEPDEARRKELMAETNEEFGNHFARHTSDMEELAYDLLNVAWADAAANDIVPQIIDTNTVGLGDPDYVDEDLRGMRAYWQGKGGQILSDIMRYERTQMPREEIATAIDIHRDEILTDFWGTFGRLTAQAQAKVAMAPAERLVELVQASVTSGDATYGTFASATLTDAQVDSILDVVAGASRGQVTLIGTAVATRKLANVGMDFGANVQERLFTTGTIGVYKGFPVVQFENFENFTGAYVLPDDEIWLVGRNAGKLTYYGAEAKVQQLSLPSFMIRWESARDAGMLLHGADRNRIGRIVLT